MAAAELAADDEGEEHAEWDVGGVRIIGRGGAVADHDTVSE